MSRKIRQLLSLANVMRRAGHRKGQVATFLLLIIVAILIFAMATANLGEVSATAVEVANAADAAALLLGSQLGSTSNQICRSLSQANDEDATECDAGKDGLEACKRTGILGIVLAAVTVAVVAFFFPAALPAVAGWVTPGAGLGSAALGGMVVGAAAGAVGGGIVQRSWSGAAWGAIQGASIGAGIAGGWGALTHAGMSTTTPMTVPVAAAPSAAAAGTVAAQMPVMGTVFITTPTAVGLATAAGLIGGSASYSNLRLIDHPAAVAQRELSKSLSGLADYERMREQTLLQALSQAVDDPNRTAGPGNPGGVCYFLPDGTPTAVNGDPFDADGDGDKNESISCFAYWLSVRVDTLARNQLLLTPLIMDFMEGPADFVPDGNDAGQSLKTRLEYALGALNYLERNEVECACQGSGGAIRSEGPTLTLFRRLYDAGVSLPSNPGGLPFFLPGPDQDAVRAFYQDPCDPTCPAAPAGWDSIDAMRSNYEEFILFAAALVYNPIIHGPKGFSTPQEWYRNLARTVDVWLPKLYDPASTTDAYDQLGFIGGEYSGWFLWLRDTYIPSLPMCKWYRSGSPLVFAEQQAPICENVQYVLNPDTGAVDKDIDPIYPCTWENNSGPNANVVNDMRFVMDNFDPDTDANFPGPICKIDWNDRALMIQEMDAMEAFVKSPNLETFILTDPDPKRHFPEAYGESPCDAEEDQVVTNEDGDKDITLVSIDAVGFIQWGGSSRLNPPELRYAYTYEYTCCKGACPGTGPDPTYTIQVKKDEDEMGVEPFPGYETFATQMRMPSSEFPTAQESFIAVLDAYKNILRSMRIGPPHNRFGSTDFDWDDHAGETPGVQDDVPDDEFAHGAGGFLFITVGEPYGYSDEEGWAGVSGIDFFQQNIAGFHQAIQNQIATALPKAEDGRLPNPLQLINDPIRGEHAVDGLYTWRDSQGVHSVNVEIGPFIKPRTEFEERGNFLVGKKCTVLKDYCENSPGCPYFGPDRAWVRITRTDPVDRQTRFWRWNPFAGTVRRTAKAYYDRRAVGLCGTGEATCP